MPEKKFLASYNPKEFDSPLLTVDAVLFTYHQGSLKVLMVERRNHPEKNKWALPGGFVDLKEDLTLEDTVLRTLKNKTGVAPPYLEQLQSYGSAKRDKRGWSVTIAYTALIAWQACESHLATVSDVSWVDWNELDKHNIAFDHSKLITDARERLRQKALYSIVPAYALANKFTLPELQHLHEVLIGKPLSKKSFRRRIEEANLLIDTGELKAGERRPAVLYRMRKHSGEFTFMRNLEG